MEEQLDKINLAVIKRKDADAIEILFKVPYCQLYKFLDGCWKITEFAGPLFLYRREETFLQHAVIILSTKCLVHYVEYICPYLEMWREHTSSFLMVRIGKQEIIGIWCSDVYCSLKLEKMIYIILEHFNYPPRPEPETVSTFKTLRVETLIQSMTTFEKLKHDVRTIERSMFVSSQSQRKNEVVSEVSVVSFVKKSLQKPKVVEKEKRPSPNMKESASQPSTSTGFKPLGEFEKKSMPIEPDLTAHFRRRVWRPSHQTPKLAERENRSFPKMKESASQPSNSAVFKPLGEFEKKSIPIEPDLTAHFRRRVWRPSHQKPKVVEKEKRPSPNMKESASQTSTSTGFKPLGEIEIYNY